MLIVNLLEVGLDLPWEFLGFLQNTKEIHEDVYSIFTEAKISPSYGVKALKLPCPFKGACK
jgi:hypothetical protein